MGASAQECGELVRDQVAFQDVIQPDAFAKRFQSQD
jgi:hypothetical protein